MSESTKAHKDEAPKELRFAIFICSTSRYQKLMEGKTVQDVSGEAIEASLKKAGHVVKFRKIIRDDKNMIRDGLKTISESIDADAVIFCGGTGIASSDVTVETVTPFLKKSLPGFGEIFRRLSYDEIGSAAVMSRAIAGTFRKKVVFCIPGSPDAVRICMDRLILPETGHILKHARE
jgi:molybdenum cofactor biosynthesis protein B